MTHFEDLLHVAISQQNYINELLLLIDYDSHSGNKRRYDGYISDKKEQRDKMRARIDALVLANKGE